MIISPRGEGYFTVDHYTIEEVVTKCFFPLDMPLPLLVQQQLCPLWSCRCAMHWGQVVRTKQGRLPTWSKKVVDGVTRPEAVISKMTSQASTLREFQHREGGRSRVQMDTGCIRKDACPWRFSLSRWNKLPDTINWILAHSLEDLVHSFIPLGLRQGSKGKGGSAQ